MTTDATWTAAERTLRDHFAAQGIELLDLTPKRDATLGIAFWVRWAAGGGGLVLVRGGEVISDPSPASVERFIELDDLAHKKTVSAEDFLYMLTVWKALPELGAMPIREHATTALNPKWVRSDGETSFVLHASRKVNTGARAKPVFPVRRATGTLGPKDITWQLEDTEVPLKR
jgi:hypothetical protein